MLHLQHVLVTGDKRVFLLTKGLRVGDCQALIVSCCGCFHGRTMGAISMSCDNEATRGFGPAVGGHVKVDFGDADALAAVLEGTVVLQTLLELAYFILT
jgi:acetylornithine/succinyldiaminopimelate/putrescine aminotransferase